MSRQVACSACGLRVVCFGSTAEPGGIGGSPAAGDHEPAATIAVVGRRRILAGERLFQRGESIHSLFALHSGFVLQSINPGGPEERVVSWHVVGDLQGLEGLAPGACLADAAAFLLEVSRRYAARGYSARRFHLFMTRRQIGRYLGLATETVSRTWARMQRQGLILLRRRELELFDLNALARLSPMSLN